MTLEADEFIRRFLLHVLPDGFLGIRHFGFLANRCKKKNLGRGRELLGLDPKWPEASDKTIEQRMLELTGVDITKCPFCKKETLRRVRKVSNSGFNLTIVPKINDSS